MTDQWYGRGDGYGHGHGRGDGDGYGHGGGPGPGNGNGYGDGYRDEETAFLFTPSASLRAAVISAVLWSMRC